MRFLSAYYDIGDIIAWNLSCSFRLTDESTHRVKKKGEWFFSVYISKKRKKTEIWMLKMKEEKIAVFNAHNAHLLIPYLRSDIQLNQRMLCHERCTYMVVVHKSEWTDVIVFRDVQSQLKKNQRTKCSEKKSPTTTQSIHVSINPLVCISFAVAFVYGQMFWGIFQASLPEQLSERVLGSLF